MNLYLPLLLVFALFSSCSRVDWHHYFGALSAEEHLVAGRIEAAIPELNSRCRQNNGTSWASCHNLLVASKFGDMEAEDISQAIYVLSTQGLDRSYFGQMLHDFETNGGWQQAYHTGMEEFRTTFSSEYVDELYTMFDVDQNIRLDGTKELVRLTDSLNMIRFDSLYHLYGFPITEKVGLQFESGKYLPQNHMWETMLTHFALQEFPRFKEILLKEYSAGNIAEDRFCDWIQPYGEFKFLYAHPILEIEGEFYQEKPEHLFIDKTNRLRDSLNLPSYAAQVSMIMYNARRRSDTSMFIIPYRHIKVSIPQHVIDQYLVPVDWDAGL